jgi:RNA-directed DNA polymerase
VLFQQLKRWTRRRPPTRHWHWVATTYWPPRGGNTWVCCTPDHVAIVTPHARHVKRQWPVKDGSPFDGDWIYWSSRLGRHPGIPPAVARLMHTPGGTCAHGGLYVTPADVVETDHRVPRSHGGSRHLATIQLLPAHGHDVKPATDLAGCTTDKGSIAEEPSLRNRLRSVLKTSARGDSCTECDTWRYPVLRSF